MHSFQLKFDEERVLLALHAAHFVPGLLLLHERAKRYQDILHHYMEVGSPADVIATCTRFGYDFSTCILRGFCASPKHTLSRAA